jgi:hypothetical protein
MKALGWLATPFCVSETVGHQAGSVSRRVIRTLILRAYPDGHGTEDASIGPHTNPKTGISGQLRLRRWRSRDGQRLFTWDSLHGEIEVFDLRGRHLGVLDAVTGEWRKGPIRGRRIDV